MKKILGLDLGVSSIGWAVVNEAENDNETNSIVRLGVRVVPLTTEERDNFKEGKSITINAERRLKRSARRNLQRFRQRRAKLLEILKENQIIDGSFLLSENGKNSTFETLRLRAKAVDEQVTLDEFARILLSINGKRGYKSNRKVKVSDKEDGQLIDSKDVAKILYERGLTPAQYSLELLKEGKENLPDFYVSDLQQELDKIWDIQKEYYNDILTDDFYNQLKGKNKKSTLYLFEGKYKLQSVEFGADKKTKKLQEFQLRNDSLTRKLNAEELVYVIADINGQISGASGYLNAISDRSKELYFKNQTVGQYLYKIIRDNPHQGLKNMVFYRQDYAEEFEKIWNKQAEFYKELSNDLKNTIKEKKIFYQRKLKSQKKKLDFCIFESRDIKIIVDGKYVQKRTGLRVCPKSSLYFQEFRIWQTINNLRVIEVGQNTRNLEIDEKNQIYNELKNKGNLKNKNIIKLLFNNNKDIQLNYEQIEGNTTLNKLYKAVPSLKGNEEYSFDSSINENEQKIVKLWHLLYSYEGDNSPTGNDNLIKKLEEDYNFSRDEARKLANISFDENYSNLSSKAIKKILPYLKKGMKYSEACSCAGYNHSPQSLTKEQIDSKVLAKKLELLPKNSLRNPIVEKILNQMVNVVNEIVITYGELDEIRIELARELKKNAQEREQLARSIKENSKLNEKYEKEIQEIFPFKYVSSNDITRYKLWKELEGNGYKTLYSDTYISREEVFDKKFDIEHIIPQSKLFDNSFSNKTLELRDVNIKKGNRTAYDFVEEEYGENGLANYLNKIRKLWEKGLIRTAKYKNLKTTSSNISEDFINRDLKDSQYIARKARELLLSIAKEVNTTTGSVTSRLRIDWQIVNVMQELNWEKYHAIGQTKIEENRDGRSIGTIKDWSKRDDHRHHAMDALTIAFTKPSFIQYLNNVKDRSDKSSSVYAIEQKELSKDSHQKLRFNPPMPINEFRSETKKHLENILVSIKAKNKVVTCNINITKTKDGNNKRVQLTPRGKLHNETIYGRIKKCIAKLENIDSSFDREKIMTVTCKVYREALLKRLKEYGDNPKKAFTGGNSLCKNPIYYDIELSKKVPERIKTVTFEVIYTKRTSIDKNLKVNKVIDNGIREILKNRLKQYGDDPAKAFVNLEDNPIWMNKEKGISIKRVTVTDINIAEPIHTKRDNNNRLIIDNNGNSQPVDFVQTSNNHHIAIYKDNNGVLKENVVSFYEAIIRVGNNLPIIDKTFKREEGWTFLFSMKKNEYFLFPDDKGFNPKELTMEFIMNEQNYATLSPHLFRVRKVSTRNYWFMHHLETKTSDVNVLRDIAWKRVGLAGIEDIVKVRINHIGKIVAVGEY
ncbi:MAG: type II CRISPR RNA-guided endonuclease Cas9 [Bacteroidales bacterium]